MTAEKATRRSVPLGHFGPAAGISSRFEFTRRLLAVSLLVVLSAGAAVDVCQGWSSHQTERKACCARMENHCATVSADNCCEKGQQRRTRDLARTVAQPALDMTPGAIVAPPVLIERDTDGLILLGRPRPHLLHEVFLI